MNNARPRVRLGRLSTFMRSSLLLSSGRTLFLAASIQNNSCISRSFWGLLGRKVVGLAEILGDVVEFPLVIIHRNGLSGRPGRKRRRRRCDPAVIVNGAIGEHLEILRAPGRGRLRI